MREVDIDPTLALPDLRRRRARLDYKHVRLADEPSVSNHQVHGLADASACAHRKPGAPLEPLAGRPKLLSAIEAIDCRLLDPGHRYGQIPALTVERLPVEAAPFFVPDWLGRYESVLLRAPVGLAVPFEAPVQADVEPGAQDAKDQRIVDLVRLLGQPGRRRIDACVGRLLRDRVDLIGRRQPLVERGLASNRHVFVGHHRFAVRLPRAQLRQPLAREYENIPQVAGVTAGAELVPASLAALVSDRLRGGRMKKRAGPQITESRTLRARRISYRRDEAPGKDPLRRAEIAWLGGALDIDRSQHLLESAPRERPHR